MLNTSLFTTDNPLSIHHGKFGAITPNPVQMPIIAMDSEDDSHGTPVLFAFYGDFPAGSFVTRHWEEAMEFIYDRVEEETIFVTHNLEYDIANLCKGDNYLLVDRMVYASALLRVEFSGIKHVFLNSTQFFKGPLAKMGEVIGIPKLEGDALSPQYCLRDAEIVYRFVKLFQKKLVETAGVNLGITIGKMAMDTYRKNHMLKKQQITYNSPNCLKAYYGGRVEIFRKGIIKNVNVIDINSCYPFVMRNFDYPDTSYMEPSTLGTHRFGIGKFTVHVPDDVFIPVLPFKSGEGRLFFPKGTFTGWWTYAEIRHAVEHGTVIVAEHEGEGTNLGCRPFNSFIDTYYQLRQECKTRLRKNPHDAEAKFDSLFYKYWLNNLYGKWCQHKDGVEMSREKWPMWKLEAAMKKKGFKTFKVGPFYNYVTPKETLPDTANFMWGIYVTSYSRIYLHKGLDSVHRAGHRLLYCDTDSIMFSPRNKNVHFSFTDKLGDWDMEHFDLGVFRQSKGYLLCNKKGKEYEIKKVACKGVPTNYAYDFIIRGMAGVMKPYRMKEALIRMNAAANVGNDAFLKEVGENVWREMEKKMQSAYIKRVGKRITYPVDAEKIPELESDVILKNLSMEKELDKSGVKIKKKINRDKFKNTVIPAGYFDRTGNRKGVPKIFISQKVFRFRREQCIGLKKGAVWFRGDVFQIRTNHLGKKFYHISVENYKGKELTHNFWGQISVKFLEGFGLVENLLKKSLEISLSETYLENTSFEIEVKVSESKNAGHIDSEILDAEEELSESELKTLMSQDWSKISCLNK